MPKINSMTNVIGNNFTGTGPIDKILKGHFNVIHDNVTIGDGSTVGSYCEIGDSTVIGKNCVLQGRVRTGPEVVIEDEVVIKYGAILTNTALIKNNAFIGPNVITLGGGHNRQRVNGIIIGKNCYIGAGTKIASGVEICDNVVIGANSFVTKDIVESGIYVGTPAKFLKGN